MKDPFNKLYKVIMQDTGPESYYDYHDVDTYAPYTDQDNDDDKLYEEDANDFNYQKELERFEQEIGNWEPLKGWQWSDEGLDENQNEFEETFLSYNGQVQVYLKEDGRIDVIDPDKKHRIFNCGDYQRAKKYITSIFKVLDQADRMRWS